MRLVILNKSRALLRVRRQAKKVIEPNFQCARLEWNTPVGYLLVGHPKMPLAECGGLVAILFADRGKRRARRFNMQRRRCGQNLSVLDRSAPVIAPCQKS